MMKPWLFCIFLFSSGIALAQPFPFNGYTLYDHLVTATHPNGCPSNYITGLPDDSTWVNMLDGTVMTGYFAHSWSDLPGDDLLLESSFHHDNYSVRLLLEGGAFSSSYIVTESMWTDLPFVNWTHMFPGCLPGQAASPRLLLPLDFGLFGIGQDAIVTGIEITFLPTSGAPDFSGAYIIVPPCGLFDLGQDTTICPGETVTIDATMPNASYLWQDGSTDPVYTAAGAGRYYVEVTIYDCSIVDTLNVTERAGPPDLGNDTLLCAGQSLELDVTTADATYEWQDNTSSSPYLVTQPGTYSVTVTIADCMYTDQIDVDFMDPPTIDLGPDVVLCEGETLLLDATTPNASYEWQDQSTASDLLVTTPGTYTVVVDVAGCTNEDEIQVGYIYPDPVDLGSDVTLCAGETIFLDAFTPGATYTWQDNATTSGYNVLTTGIYAVTVTTGDCSASDEIDVAFVPAFDIDLGKDTTLCNGTTLLLNATTPNASYLWQDQSTADTLLVSASGKYWVDAYINGCSVSDTIVIMYNNPPHVDLGEDTTLCTPTPILLDAFSAGATYIWQDNSTASTFAVTQPGLYHVIVTKDNCTASDTVMINFTPIAPIYLGVDTTLCSGSTLTLDAGLTHTSLEWQDHSTASTYMVSQPGSYWVTAHEGNCTTADTIKVDYLSLLSLDFGMDTMLCSGQSLTLDATITGASYLWQDNTTSSSYTISQAGKYWVDVSIGNCQIADTMDVDFTVPSIPYLGADTILCAGETLLLDPGTQGGSYQWQDNTNGQNYIVALPGEYAVTVSAGACEVADTIQVAYHDLPVIDLGSDTTLCEGETTLLNAFAPGISYLWQDQSTQPDYLVTEPGTYFVDLYDGLCQSSDTIQVAYLSITSISLGPDTILCADQTLVLDPHAPGAQYLWQDNSTNSTFTATDSGLYWVQVIVGACEATDSIQIDIADAVQVDLGADTALCAGATLLLEATSPGAIFEWNDHSALPTYLVSQPGTYWVTADVSGCRDVDSIYVAYIILPQNILGEDTTLCEGESLLLNAAYADATYLWFDHSTDSTFLVMEPGNYTLTVRLHGCMVEETIHIGYAAPFNVDLGMDQTICQGEHLALDPGLSSDQYCRWQDQSTSSTYIVYDAGEYSIQVSDACGISADTITIDVDPCTCHLYFPNVFSPNGDLINDYAFPVASCELAYSHLKIFDRFGDLLYQAQVTGAGWDGSTRSKPAQSGVYTYLLEYAFTDGKRRSITGDLTLLR